MRRQAIVTGVELAYPDGAVEDESSLTVYDTRLGGRPIFASQSPDYFVCKVCKEQMRLLLQAYAPLNSSDNEGYDRVLYVYGCAKRSCTRKEGSIRACRYRKKAIGKDISGHKQQQHDSTSIDKPAINPFNSMNGTNSKLLLDKNTLNPFASKKSSTNANKSASTADDDSINTDISKIHISPPSNSSTTEAPQTVKNDLSEKVSLDSTDHPASFDYTKDAYHNEYLETEPESLSTDTPTVDPLQVSGDFSMTSEIQNAWGAETYEKSKGDKYFRRFCDRIGQNPEQCVRYQRGGNPLLYSQKDPLTLLYCDEEGNFEPAKVPKCPKCGSSRNFELQLTPHAAAILDEDEGVDSALEWGAICVASCASDCAHQNTIGNDAFWAEEFAHVSWEDDSGAMLFSGSNTN